MVAPSPREPHGSSLGVGVSAAEIRAALFSEDCDAFDAALSCADPPQQDVLEEWRRRAILQSDPQAFQRSIRCAAEFFTGEPVPEDEPYEITRARTGM